MNRVILLFCVMFLFSCKSKETKPSEKQPPMVEVTGKLEKLLSLPQDSVLEYYDLSGDFIMELPDLSAYTIKSLNLSHNYIDSIIPIFFPKGIERLNLSHNYLKDFPQDNKPLKKLKELNLSHNNIKEYLVEIIVERLDVSYNDLHYIALSRGYMYYYSYWRKKGDIRMSYLNISNNPNLSNEVFLVPSLIDTIIYNNIANDKELKMIDWRLK